MSGDATSDEEGSQEDSSQYDIDDLEIVKTIGTGTFGRVVLCRHHGRPLALKVLSMVDIIRLKQVEHVRNEISVLKEVNHPFIVNMLWNGRDEARVYMLLEFVAGGELFSYLRAAGRFPGPTSCFYAAEIVCALEYLHSRHIVYRDLKPENLLLDNQGHLKITDFGFSKKLTDRYANILLLPYRGKTMSSMKLSDIMELNHLSIMNLSSSLRLPCKDVVKSCWWQKTEVNCEKIFRRSYSAYGPCCSFNYLLEDRIEVERKKMEKPNPVRTAYFGEHFGLSFVINRNQFVDEERNNDIPESAISSFSGLIIMTHNSFDYPSEKVGYIVVEPGHEFQLRIKVLREKLTPEVFSMSEERRDCVIENERVLEYFPEYRHLNCFVECRINVTLEVCGCIPFYYAALLNEKMNQICDLKGNSCISRSSKKIWDLLFNAGGNRTGSCNSCPDLCENVNYLSQHSEYSISEKRFTYSPLYQNLTSEETVIKVYLASQVYTTMSIISIADGIYILSSLGGIFSLFLGCSFLTIIEVLYFIGLFLREFLSNRKTQTGFTVSR